MSSCMPLVSLLKLPLNKLCSSLTPITKCMLEQTTSSMHSRLISTKDWMIKYPHLICSEFCRRIQRYQISSQDYLSNWRLCSLRGSTKCHLMKWPAVLLDSLYPALALLSYSTSLSKIWSSTLTSSTHKTWKNFAGLSSSHLEALRTFSRFWCQESSRSFTRLLAKRLATCCTAIQSLDFYPSLSRDCSNKKSRRNFKTMMK